MTNARYRIEQVLGTGGSGCVHRAFDESEGRMVAIKRINPNDQASPKDVERARALFEREYYVLAQLAHPKIIQVYDYGVDDDGPYYTMEWLKGASLRQRTPLPVPEACTLLRDIASSLAIIHSRRLVHRDVTPHNIYCPEEGHAKLIDFGAMTPMGVPKVVVGTPPFMAPECFDHQPVDGRTDLFSLGACLYYALTGRHAYSARTISELVSVWKVHPVWPSRLNPAVPEALDRLILELLSLQPAGRPSSAAEVFERLTTAAGLDRDESPTVARAYLSSPALSGRRSTLARLLRKMLRAVRGKGSSAVITGPAGIGRSRLLDATVLEAKLSGFVVLRADTSGGRTASLAAIRSMARALGEVEPDAARLLTAAGSTDGDATGDAVVKRRDDGISAVAQVIHDVSRRRAVAVVVDDLHRIDEASLAALALLASATEGVRLLLLGTIDSDAVRASDPALSHLMASSSVVPLGPLSAPETRALLSSMFGEVPNLDTVSALAHESTRGNARALLDAAQGLVDDELAVYAGGDWTISGDPEAIGRAFGRSTDIAQRLSALSTDARTLVSVLALDRDAQTALGDYAGLAFGGDRARANNALSELLHHHDFVELVDDRCQFVRETQRRAVVLALPEATRRELHEKLAECVVRVGANPVYPAYHYCGAGKTELAGIGLGRLRDFIDANPGAAIVREPIVLDTVEQILSMDGAYSEGFRAEHGAGLVISAVYQGLPERAAPHAPGFLERLSWLTGLDDYHARPDLPPGERLGLAFGLAQQRCSEESAHGLDPVGAVRRLCQLSITTAICARFMADPELLSAIPDLSPFAVLSPAVALAARIVSALGMLVRGQSWDAWDAVASVCAELRGPAGEGIDAMTRLALEGSARGLLCSLQAEHAVDGALPNIDSLSQTMPNLAESYRARYYFALGMTRESEAARQKFELLSVRSKGMRDARIIELPAYLELYALSGDVLGLKRTLAATLEVAKTRPRWKSRVALASAHLSRCRGDFAAGLRTIEASLTDLSSDRADWGPSVALRIALLEQTGDAARAVEVGLAALAEAATRQVPPVAIGLALALALARAGDSSAAERHWVAVLVALGERAAAGIVLGRCYEVGARIASLSGDRAAFKERAEACGQHYRRGENPLLTARYDALLRSDRAFDRRAGNGADDAATIIERRPRAVELVLTDSTRSGSTVDGVVHADVLALLVESAGARGGFLYARTDVGWCRVCGTPGLEVPRELDDTVIQELTRERHEPVTLTLGAVTAPTVEPRWHWDMKSSSGDYLLPCFLEEGAGLDEHVVGVAVLAVQKERSLDIPTTSLAAAVRALVPRRHAAL